MRACVVSCQDVCRRACTVVSTKHGPADVPGLDQVNAHELTPLMVAVSAGNEVMALELVWTLVALYGGEISNTA